MSDDATKENLLEQIAEIHEAFVELMNQRLPEAETGQLELYLGVFGKLVNKLEDEDKSLNTAAQEMFGEVAALVMSQMGK